MALVCIQPPLIEPVSLSELKDMLRLDQGDTSQDDVLMDLESAARGWCEGITRRKFVSQQWAVMADFFPGYIDTKLTGQSFSSPFVSGANAILVGIRYALILPFPPVRSLDSFIYQNANGQVTSMIVGPLTITAVSNPLGQQVTITTSAPHGLQTSATVTVAGNVPLLAALAGQASQVIQVLGDSALGFLGSLGTGASIASGGTVTGYNFVEDLVSEPARLTPIFGQMWPVARVVVNAVQATFTAGYASPISVSTTDGSAALGTAILAPSNIGQPISIPGAGPNGGTLNTLIAAVDGSGHATLQRPAQAAVAVNGLIVDHGKPHHWGAIKLAIKFLVNSWFIKRLPDLDPNSDPLKVARSQLSIAMDLRL